MSNIKNKTISKNSNKENIKKLQEKIADSMMFLILAQILANN